MTTASKTDAQLLARLQSGELAGSWVLDPARSSVALRSRSMWGLVPVKGRFTDVGGSGTVSASGEVTGTITIAASSIDTKQKKRDEHLRSADFFDAANHPSIVVAIRSVTVANDGLVATADLTVREVTRPVSMPLTAVAVADGVQLSAEITVDRTDFGLTWNQMGMASTKNVITITAVFTPQAAEPS